MASKPKPRFRGHRATLNSRCPPQLCNGVGVEIIVHWIHPGKCDIIRTYRPGDWAWHSGVRSYHIIAYRIVPEGE